jgi:hypothetical protein
MAEKRHLIIHDTDRDGWGSAAMLVAELGPARCVLHPTASKDGLAEIAKVDAHPGDHVWVLDIPTPGNWTTVPSQPDVAVTFKDRRSSYRSISPFALHAALVLT